MNNILTKSYINSINTISGFSDKYEIISINSINKISTDLIESYFNYQYSNKCIISKPIYNNSNNTIQIQLFYYYSNESRIVKKLRRRYSRFIKKYILIKRSKNNSRIWSKPIDIITINNNKSNAVKLALNGVSINTNNFMKIISKGIIKNLLKKDIKVLVIILENIYNKKVIIKINRIHYPYLNAQILSKYLSYCQHSKTFLHFSKAIIKYPRYFGVTILSSIAGIKISLQGRLVTQKVVPRKTVKMKIVGKFKNKKPYLAHKQSNQSNKQSKKIYEKYNICVGETYFKNQLGVFTIKVEIAQRVNKKIIPIMI